MVAPTVRSSLGEPDGGTGEFPDLANHEQDGIVYLLPAMRRRLALDMTLPHCRFLTPGNGRIASTGPGHSGRRRWASSPGARPGLARGLSHGPIRGPEVRPGNGSH